MAEQEGVRPVQVGKAFQEEGIACIKVGVDGGTTWLVWVTTRSLLCCSNSGGHIIKSLRSCRLGGKLVFFCHLGRRYVRSFDTF